MAKLYLKKDIIDALHYYMNAIITENELIDFDKASDQVLKLTQRMIFLCGGNVHAARERLNEEGLDMCMDVYLEMA